MKTKDCKNCLFVGSISAQTKSVFCSLNKEVSKMICKDYIEKKDMPTWEQITRKNEIEQIAFNFGSNVEPEKLPTKKNEVLKYVSKLKKQKPKPIKIKPMSQNELDFLNYGITTK